MAQDETSHVLGFFLNTILKFKRNDGQNKHMPWFKCFVAGKNFPGVLIDQTSPVGFYTTCFVEAVSPNDVDERVLDLLRQDSRLIPQSNSSPPSEARVFIEEVIEIPANEVSSQLEGFVWYRMDES